jgi:hypothetical protein
LPDLRAALAEFRDKPRVQETAVEWHPLNDH